MKIPIWILQALVVAMLAGEGWTLKTVIELKEDVAVLKTLVNSNQKIAQK